MTAKREHISFAPRKFSDVDDDFKDVADLIARLQPRPARTRAHGSRRRRRAACSHPSAHRCACELRRRRETALLNTHGLPAVNHKRVYRVMRAAKLMLERHTGKEEHRRLGRRG